MVAGGGFYSYHIHQGNKSDKERKIVRQQGRKRPLDTPKRLIERRERERRREREKGRRSDIKREGERERELKWIK